MDSPGAMEVTAGVDMLLKMLRDYDTDDARVQAFVECVEWAAFWIQGHVDNPELQARVQRLCESGDEIMAGMSKAMKEFHHEHFS